MTTLPGRWTTVLVFSGCGLSWRRCASGPQPVGRQGAGGWIADRSSRGLSRERGLRPVWHVTEGPGHARSIVRGLPEGASVVAVGGDGTVHEVAAACAGTGRIMGVLPAGSGNDYVKAHRRVARISGGRWKCSSGGESVSWIQRRSMESHSTTVSVSASTPRSLLASLRRLRISGGQDGTCGRSGGCSGTSVATRPGSSSADEVIEARTILVAVAIGTTYGSMFQARAGGGTRRRSLRCDLVRGSEPGRGSAAHTSGLTGHARRAQESAYGPRARSRGRTLRRSAGARRR